MPSLFNTIRKLVADDKYLIGLHAAERLEVRGIMEWHMRQSMPHSLCEYFGVPADEIMPCHRLGELNC